MKQFAKKISQKVKKAIFLKGEESNNLIRLMEKFDGDDKIVGTFADLKKAVLKARDCADQGDVVLFSPGCASFGMFTNEFDRGDRFNKIVNSLKNG